MNASRRFEGKVALITGAASGIGRAVAVRLASEGAQVLGHDLDAEGLAATAGIVTSAGGIMQTRSGDISRAAECRAAVAACVDAFGRLDVLGNNAGIARAEHVTDVTEDQYRQMMGVNIDGYFFTAQAAIPHLLETGGNIVNVASNAGLMGAPYSAAYCASKGGVVNLTRALADEYLTRGVRVNAVAPGGTLGTDLRGPVALGLAGESLGDRPGREEELRARVPLAVALTPSDHAASYVFLASEGARGITGTFLHPDGGIGVKG